MGYNCLITLPVKLNRIKPGEGKNSAALSVCKQNNIKKRANGHFSR